MVLLGKLLKGRSTRAPKDLRDIRIRRIKMQIQQEDLKNEEEFRKRKREHLRNSIQEEQKITNFKLVWTWNSRRLCVAKMMIKE